MTDSSLSQNRRKFHGTHFLEQILVYTYTIYYYGQNIIIAVIIIIELSEFFTSALADGIYYYLLLESFSHQR